MITQSLLIQPLQAVSAIVDNISEDTIIVGDGAEAYHWLNEVIRQNLAGSYITHGFLGAVGMGLGLGGCNPRPKDPQLDESCDAQRLEPGS